MIDELNDFENPDFSWIRWQRLRWDFVGAIIKSNENHRGPGKGMCTGPDCCLEMARLLAVMGLEPWTDDREIGFDGESEEGLDDDREENYAFQIGPLDRMHYAHEFGPHITGAMRDGMMILAGFVESDHPNPLDGYMEVPYEVGQVVHSRYFNPMSAAEGPSVMDEPRNDHRDLLYAFAHLAFPDEFLSTVNKAVRPNFDE